jgi:hypothetical protein
MSEDEGSIIWGLLICWGLNILEIFLGFLALGAGLGGNGNSMGVTIVLVGGVGLFQLLYLLPIYVLLRNKGKAETMKGMIIAASITALLNASCWGMFMGH